MRRMVLVLAGLAVAVPVTAQLPKGDFPDGFVVRTDDPAASASEVVFTTMRPGWHITTGPAAILYDGALRAESAYRVDVETFLFDPGDRREAYGVFTGGSDLTGDGQVYTYFVIRHTGEFMIGRRRGGRVETVVEWTAHPAIVTWAGKGEAGTAKNILSIEVADAAVRFLVNGAALRSLAQEGIDVDGTVGLRVGEGVNLHVSSLVVTKK